MPDLVQMDDEGRPHILWIQGDVDTCGPACVYMIESMTRQASMSGGEQRIKMISSLLPGGYYRGEGTQDRSLAQTLCKIGVPAHFKFSNNIFDILDGDAFPFIARIRWPSGSGHFIVVAGQTKSDNLICLDPVYGLILTPRSTLPGYQVTSKIVKGPTIVGAGFSGEFIVKDQVPS